MTSSRHTQHCHVELLHLSPHTWNNSTAAAYITCRSLKQDIRKEAKDGSREGETERGSAGERETERGGGGQKERQGMTEGKEQSAARVGRE